jgi:hypothetical protein
VTNGTGVLVSAPDLLTEDRGGLVLLDVRWALGDDRGREHYLAGHLPDAVVVDLETELAAPASPAKGAIRCHRYSDCNERPGAGASATATASWPMTTPAAWPRREPEEGPRSAPHHSHARGGTLQRGRQSAGAG